MGGSRIPEGTYIVGVRQEGAMTERYRCKYPTWFQGMLHVRNVENYTNVYIHIGNFATDTQGCLLVGEGAAAEMVTNSVKAYKRLYLMVIDAAWNGELTITYTDDE